MVSIKHEEPSHQISLGINWERTESVLLTVLKRSNFGLIAMIFEQIFQFWLSNHFWQEVSLPRTKLANSVECRRRSVVY